MEKKICSAFPPVCKKISRPGFHANKRGKPPRTGRASSRLVAGRRAASDELGPTLSRGRYRLYFRHSRRRLQVFLRARRIGRFYLKARQERIGFKGKSYLLDLCSAKLLFSRYDSAYGMLPQIVAIDPPHRQVRFISARLRGGLKRCLLAAPYA